MSEVNDADLPARRKGLIWAAVVGAAALVVFVTWGLLGGWQGASPSPNASPTSTVAAPAASETASVPSETPTVGDPDGSDAPDPDERQPDARPTLPPVAIDQEAEPVTGLIVTLVSIEAIDGRAAVPGETSGPALAVTLRGENDSTEIAHTEAVIVNLYYGADRIPANILVNPRADFPQSVAPGGAETGTFAFSVPLDQRGQVLIEVDLSLDMPVVLFEGAV